MTSPAEKNLHADTSSAIVLNDVEMNHEVLTEGSGSQLDDPVLTTVCDSWFRLVHSVGMFVGMVLTPFSMFAGSLTALLAQCFGDNKIIWFPGYLICSLILFVWWPILLVIGILTLPISCFGLCFTCNVYEGMEEKNSSDLLDTVLWLPFIIMLSPVIGETD